jgi:hypothetical protein
MIAQSIVKPSQPLWREQSDRWLKRLTATTAIASAHQPTQEIDPVPPPAACDAPSWPRVFPGL